MACHGRPCRRIFTFRHEPHYPRCQMARRPNAAGTRKRGSKREKSAPRKTRRLAPASRIAGVVPGRLPEVGSGLAPGMLAINTFLAVANVTATMEFLERVLGFSRGVVLPDVDGHVRYAEMRHGDSVVMLVRKGDATTPSGGAPALYTYVGDVDRQLAAARALG